MITGIVGVITAIDAATVKHDGSKLSEWFDVSSGFSFSIFYKQNSAAGTPSHAIYVQVSPYDAKTLNDLVTAGTDTAAYYVSATLATGVTTENTMIRYTDSILTTPFRSIRIYVAGGGAAEDTVCSAYIVSFS